MQHKKWWTVFALLACALAATGVADKLSDEYAADALERAFFTWAIARGLNGIISVAQGTEVAIEPGGVGVNLSVGEILDPVNDLIEQFSSVMLVATSSIGLQNLLLRITGTTGVSILMAVSALFALVAIWWPALESSRLRSFALRFFVITFFLRFAVPILVIGSNFVFDQFLAREQIAATQALQTTSEDIEALSEEPVRAKLEDQSMLERFGNMIDDSLSTLNVRERIDALRERVGSASEHVVNLIVIFMLQTVLLPLALIWALLEALKSLAGRATKWQN